MTYLFVPSHVNIGRAKGPRLAIVAHMAEGGGTVGYLAKQNPNGVSVHAVIERTGRIVQMLPWDNAHTSIRIRYADGRNALRTSDDPAFTWRGEEITYGATAAKAVMGSWARADTTLGPNHASIGVEVEGYASDGPNDKQKDAIARLWGELRRMYPSIRSLGHKDFNSYKACPGKAFPWDEVGGHGPAAAEGDMNIVESIYPFAAPRIWRVAAGTTLHGYSARQPGTVVKTSTFTSASWAHADAEVYVSYPGTTSPPVPRGGPFLRVKDGVFAGLLIVAAQVTLDPDTGPDCSAIVADLEAKHAGEIAAASAIAYNQGLDAAKAAVAGLPRR